MYRILNGNKLVKGGFSTRAQANDYIDSNFSYHTASDMHVSPVPNVNSFENTKSKNNGKRITNKTKKSIANQNRNKTKRIQINSKTWINVTKDDPRYHKQ